VNTARKPWWQQATALVTVSAGGVITGFNFVPGAAALTTPAGVPLHQLALEQAAQPDTAGKATAGDAQLRAAIVNVAGYYLKLAKTKTPAQIEALIWGDVSSDGADHGPSCAAFASLTLELAAQTTGLRSWVTGGTTYPWPLPAWADVRVDTNPASPQITSVAADAQAHGRWHPLGDGYIPQAGDWAVYDGHVAVITSYSGGVLDTIAADSLPGLTVNAHSSAAPLADQGVVGFVDNGNLQPATGDTSGQAVKTAPQSGSKTPANAKAAPAKVKAAAAATAAVPGVPGAVALAGTGGIPGAGSAAVNEGPDQPAKAAVPGVLATGQLLGEPAAGAAPESKPAPASAPLNIKPAPSTPSQPAAPAPAVSPSPSSASSSPKRYATPATRDQQAFISLVAPGTVAAQQRYGIPASVTIAQAIEESAWARAALRPSTTTCSASRAPGPPEASPCRLRST
jgi:flagellum-specific peptidoglycan hydrolase FlgJ